MSVAEFSNSLKDAAYKAWYKKSQKSILIQSAASLRKEEQVASKTSFILRPADIVVIASKLSGREVTNKELQTIVKDLKSAIPKRHGRTLPIVKKDDGTLYYPKVSFETISTILEKGFSSLNRQLIKEENGKEREVRISDFFQRGHVFGVATNILDQTISNFKASKVPEETKAQLLGIMEEILKELRTQDLETSNIKDLEFPLYAKYSKNKYRYLVEMQWGSENAASGQSAAPILNMLRRYLDPDNYVQLNKFFKSRATEDAFIQKLITSRGSPSYLDLIEENIVSILTGNGEKNRTFVSPEILLDTFKIPFETKVLNREIKKNIQQISAAISKLKSTPTTRPAPKGVNLTSLQVLLNRRLHDQIKQNMGTPALNYKTGRFASSAKVLRMTESRQGMITAFYTYMKNPYQTFEPGFAQGSAARNPKTLISKSIREIAQELVGNRMRAVLV